MTKLKFLIALMALALPGVAKAAENAYFIMQSSVAASAAGSRIAPVGSKVAFQVNGRTSAGAGEATIVIRASNDGVTYVQVSSMTFTLSTTVTSTGTSLDSAWRYFISSATTISGTNAVISVFASSKQ